MARIQQVPIIEYTQPNSTRFEIIWCQNHRIIKLSIPKSDYVIYLLDYKWHFIRGFYPLILSLSFIFSNEKINPTGPKRLENPRPGQTGQRLDHVSQSLKSISLTKLSKGHDQTKTKASQWLTALTGQYSLGFKTLESVISII